MTSTIGVKKIQYPNGTDILTLDSSGSLTIDTNTLHVDASNNRVGVGTASPNSALHVSGGAGTNVAIQSSAGTHWRIGDGVGSTNGNLVIYDYTDSRKVFEIDTLGHVTKPAQSAFMAYASTQNNIAVASNVNVVFANERFDQNEDFDGASTFTAPVTGKYQFNASLYLNTLDQASAYYYIELQTSNELYYNIIDSNKFSGDIAYWTLTLSHLVDMDASDTAVIRINQANGDSQTDINANSFFSGYLVA